MTFAAAAAALGRIQRQNPMFVLRKHVGLLRTPASSD
jgi:hypothetical protein